MNSKRRQFLVLLAAAGIPFTRGTLTQNLGSGRFDSDQSLNIAGGALDKELPSANPDHWDLYFGARPSDSLQTLLPFVSTDNGWNQLGLSLSEIDAKTVRGMADHVVKRTRELENAFNTLTAGDTVWIDGRNAPYRTTQWLDIDVSGVSVIGPGITNAIKPADGANVGGIRVGQHNHCRNITIRDVGYHGNEANQDKSAKKCHGIIVRDAVNVVLTGNTITHTHPYGEHGSGGSGISVERNSENVRIVNNRIQFFGDRGIQLGGKNVVVSENVITDGIDRAIACDLWAPNGKNDVANTVIISGNILGNCSEGSLAGVASGPKGEEAGGTHSIITDNIGFGSHKSFCHVRGPTNIHHVSIRGNISTQSTDGLSTKNTTKFAGIAIDPAGGSSITVSGNELSGYSHHGINVQSPVSDIKIADNIIQSPNGTGIRVQNAAEGTIINNIISQAGNHGILLTKTQSITVANNHIREVAKTGISVRSPGKSYHEISENYLSKFNKELNPNTPAIQIASSKIGVRGNTIAQTPSSPALAEKGDASENIYENNRAEDENSWEVTSASSVVRNNLPPFDAHRGVADEDEDGQIAIEFAKPYTEPPMLSFARRGEGIRRIEYITDSDNLALGVLLDVRNPGEKVDVFVKQI